MQNVTPTSEAEVAYVQVNADGSSPNLNSGVTTAKTSTGTYTVTLPAGEGQTNDLIFVQILGSGFSSLSSKVFDTSPLIKTISISDISDSPADAPFNLIISRSTLP